MKKFSPHSRYSYSDKYDDVRVTIIVTTTHKFSTADTYLKAIKLTQTAIDEMNKTHSLIKDK